MKPETRAKKHQDVKDWSLRPRIEFKREKHYSADELIDAYFRGRRDQFEEDKKILLESFSDSLKRAKKVCEEFFEKLEENGIKCSFVSLRAMTISHFDAVFVVPKKKFVALDFDAVYRMAREKKKEVTTNTFNFSFSFMPLTDSLNEGRMLTDGYIMKYAKKED
jgi:hypothetical protein